MELTINSRILGRAVTFFKASDTETRHYIFVDLNGKSGYLGEQICKGGRLMGSTLKASDGDFKKICKQWLRLYYKNV